MNDTDTHTRDEFPPVADFVPTDGGSLAAGFPTYLTRGKNAGKHGYGDCGYRALALGIHHYTDNVPSRAYELAHGTIEAVITKWKRSHKESRSLGIRSATGEAAFTEHGFTRVSFPKSWRPGYNYLAGLLKDHGLIVAVHHHYFFVADGKIHDCNGFTTGSHERMYGTRPVHGIYTHESSYEAVRGLLDEAIAEWKKTGNHKPETASFSRPVYQLPVVEAETEWRELNETYQTSPFIPDPETESLLAQAWQETKPKSYWESMIETARTLASNVKKLVLPEWTLDNDPYLINVRFGNDKDRSLVVRCGKQTLPIHIDYTVNGDDTLTASVNDYGITITASKEAIKSELREAIIALYV